MKIAVLGGGNGAYAAAADLAGQGHAVSLWRRDAEALRPVAEAGSLELVDHTGTRDVPLARVSGEIGEVLTGSEVVLMPGPAMAQADIAAAMAPHLCDGQILFMPPGSFGSFLVARWLRDAGCRAEVALAESGTLPYLTRKKGPGTIAIVTRATRLPTGVFPGHASAATLAALGELYPAIEPLVDGLDGALMNAGPVIHPPLILLNAGPLQHFDHWDIHNEGTQPAIRSVTDTLDAERIAVREALGYPGPHFPLADHYNPDGEEWMYGNAAHERLVDSEKWREFIDLHRHRYMREDVACGLAFLVSVADYAGVPAPVARGLLAIASAIIGEDLRQAGRTLEACGLANLSRAEMRALMDRGLPA